MDVVKEQIANEEVKNEEISTSYDYSNDIKKISKRVKRIEILSCVIVMLVALSIALPYVRNVINQKVLPSEIDTTALIKNIQEAYNSENGGERIYTILGDWSKSRVSYDQTVKTFSSTTKTLGKLTDVRFNNYQYKGNNEGADWFILNYAGLYEAGSGKVDVNIRIVDGKWEIAGVFFNVNVMK
ncbi:MAG: hypothetical protein ABFD08_05030 [Syntrophomonas sp.]